MTRARALVPEALRRTLPRRSDYAGLSRSWSRDLVAGVSVGVVALPLALAFGVSSGLGAAAGLATAIVAGVVAAVAGGSSVQVSGPTGAMTVVLLPVVAQHGVAAVAAVAVLAGVVVMVMGWLRLGRTVTFIPWPVICGFTVGIATIIGLQQVPSALGVPAPEGENTAWVAMRALGRADVARVVPALALVALVVAVMVFLPRLRRSLPASLVAVVVATVVAELADMSVPRIGAIPGALPQLAVPDLSPAVVTTLVPSALAVAALCAIESLLSARVADGMSDATETDPDRELVGQGLANVAAGFFGGMPATGAIARTAVNVRAGARTRLAAVMHAVVLVVIVLAGAGLVALIPLPALGGVLIVTAFRMVEPHAVLTILRTTRAEAFVMVATAVATVVFDLIIAVGLGMALAGVLALRDVARLSQVRLEESEDADETLERGTEEALLDEHIAVYRLDGALFFGAAQRFLDELTTIADVRVVILRLGSVQLIDSTGAAALGEIVAGLERRGITVLLKGIRPEHDAILRTVGTLDRVRHENHIVRTLDEALTHARSHVRRAAASVPPAAGQGA